MSVLVFEHCAAEDTAILGATLQAYGQPLRVIKPYTGQPIPANLEGVSGLITMGGPMNVDQTQQHPWIDQEIQLLRLAHERSMPMVGVCLGCQLIAVALGGQVDPMPQPQIGWHPVTLEFAGTMDPIMAGIGWQTTQLHLHSQQVTQLPPQAAPLARSSACKHQAFRVGMKTYAFQYHFEWDRQVIAKALSDPIVANAGSPSDQILQQADAHYEAYSRSRDRLCNTMAMSLFVNVGR